MITKIQLFFTVLLISICSFVKAQEPDYSLARIGKKVQGVYIFLNAEPAQAYDFIATIKVNDFWEERTPQEAFDRLITKAKKKYPNFNGIIFHSDDFHTADLIKFKGLDIGSGGFRVGDKVSFVEGGDKVTFGEIIAVNSSKQEATFKFLTEYNAEKIETVRFTKLQLLSEDDYSKAIKSAEGSKKIFTVNQFVSWPEQGEMKYGIIQEVNIQTEKAVIKYKSEIGLDKIKTKSLSDIIPAKEADYQSFVDKIQIEVSKHTFIAGDKVKWIRGSGSIIQAVIVSFDATTMKATVKYTNDKNLEKVNSVDAFDLVKDE
jgi:hypothetical protein